MAAIPAIGTAPAKLIAASLHNLSKTAEQRYLEFRKLYPGLESSIAQKHVATYLGITPAYLNMMRKEKQL